MRTWRTSAVLAGVVILGLIAPAPAVAQTCRGDEFRLSTQEAVNNFQANFGPCDSVTYLLMISGPSITDLGPLSGLINIDVFEVLGNAALTDLSLSGLATVNPGLTVSDNPALRTVSLPALSGVLGSAWFSSNDVLASLSLPALDTAGDLVVLANNALADLSLPALSSVRGELRVENDPALSSLSLPVLTTVGSHSGFFYRSLKIAGNDSLSELVLPALSAVGQSLSVKDNGALVRLSLPALSSVGENLEVVGNLRLADCCGLLPVLDGSIAGTVLIENNAEGCNSVAEARQGCCGDGNVDAGEGCDDGNAVNGDGCRADCTVEMCGDGILDPPTETCDDGNNTDGDGCSSTCIIEMPTLGQWGGILLALILLVLGVLGAQVLNRQRPV